MNISRKWLREFVDITATDKEYDSVMTLAGQKVETTERMDAEIKNVVVGKVLSMKKHENSDHMWVCMVDCGSGEPVQIVTGAQNVHEGDLVPVAQHNSYLPGGIHITKGKLRGVESCGMLCSYKELGLTEHDCPEAYADGIWILNDEGCEVGEDMNVVIGNDDSIVEFEITNNRPDCYSLLGLARETAAAFADVQRYDKEHGVESGEWAERRATVGMLGFPNVGKSSLINVLLGVTATSHGAVRVAVGATPGKTKHLQTCILSDTLMLCDCPGLVFPVVMNTKADLLFNGVLPASNMREYIGGPGL